MMKKFVSRLAMVLAAMFILTGVLSPCAMASGLWGEIFKSGLTGMLGNAITGGDPLDGFFTGAGEAFVGNKDVQNWGSAISNASEIYSFLKNPKAPDDVQTWIVDLAEAFDTLYVMDEYTSSSAVASAAANYAKLWLGFKKIDPSTLSTEDLDFYLAFKMYVQSAGMTMQDFEDLYQEIIDGVIDGLYESIFG